MRLDMPQGCLSPNFRCTSYKESTMYFIYCELPLNRVGNEHVNASNEKNFHGFVYAIRNAAVSDSNVRLMRRPQEDDNTRFALSGKLSDVCAALEQLEAQEIRNAWRCAIS